MLAARTAFTNDRRASEVDHIATADAIASAAHASQVDKAGMPYVGHVRRVASYVDPSNADAVVAALLHDVIEDSGITAAELADRGVPAVAIEAVDLLTRRANVSPADYYQRIRDHPIAREVKLADLADNTDPGRLATLGEPDRARLTRKYAVAYQALGADFDDGAQRRSRARR
jgi:(p)ppGpp synthase/HD superfamily hydrolase